MKQLFPIIRKISLPVLAIVLGVALAVSAMAFANAKKVSKNIKERHAAAEMAWFEYNPPSGPNPYSQANVSNPANWNYISSSGDCDDENHFPCSIKVADDYYTTPSGGTPVLNTSGTVVTIATQQYGTSGVYYVTDGGSIEEKQNWSGE